MKKTISKLKNHHIVCGYGRMGAVIAKELKDKNQKFLIIENNEEKVETKRSLKFIKIQPNEEEILQHRLNLKQIKNPLWQKFTTKNN